MGNRQAFQAELRELINRKSMEGELGNTPDFVLAGYLMSCLDAFVNAAGSRERLRVPQTLDDLTLKPLPKTMQVAPVIEATYDRWHNGMQLRVWQRAEGVNDETDWSDVDDLFTTTIFDSPAALATMVANMPGVAAVQVNISTTTYTRGVVVYVDWP